jgi:ribosomal protein L22
MGKAKTERRLKDNEAQAVARTIRVSPQKLNLVAAMIECTRRPRVFPQAYRRHRQEDAGIGNRQRREQP